LTATIDSSDGVHSHGAHSGYRHEALLYAGHDEFIAGTVPFIHGALATDEPILVVLSAAKIRTLRAELGSDRPRVLFADMAEVGANPGRIIPAWQDFLDAHAAAGGRLWGIGEPIWAGRRGAELEECQRHEQLLNVVFSDPGFSLLCPYDTSALGDAVIEEARRSHPFVCEDGRSAPSHSFPGSRAMAEHDHGDLPDAPGAPAKLAFREGELHPARAWVAARAKAAGLAGDRIPDLLLAVNEIATNSLLHGGGGGRLSVWRDGGVVVCEIRDGGRVTDPLAGRRRPSATAPGGRGLWIANQVCDLVQVRAVPEGTVVRLHMQAAADI
jgi:anti-sigma regulatory factor (Ser/Thr protein kinase)